MCSPRRNNSCKSTRSDPKTSCFLLKILPKKVCSPNELQPKKAQTCSLSQRNLQEEASPPGGSGGKVSDLIINRLLQMMKIWNFNNGLCLSKSLSLCNYLTIWSHQIIGTASLVTEYATINYPLMTRKRLLQLKNGKIMRKKTLRINLWSKPCMTM